MSTVEQHVMPIEKPAVREVKVWDPLVRVFHWTLVIGFFTAYFTEGEEETLFLHTWAGYTVAGLVLVRLLWGFIGTRHARFSDFVRRPTVVKDYLSDVLRLKPQRYLGHNPAGGLMIVLWRWRVLLGGRRVKIFDKNLHLAADTEYTVGV